MDRRAFLRLAAGGAVASVLPPIWFPLAPQSTRTIDRLPTGLGLGINLDCHEDERPALFEQAIATFQPTWCYHWRCWPVNGQNGFVPHIRPHPWSGNPDQPYPADLLRSYVRVMAEAGADVMQGPWFLGNEPEWSGWTPERVVGAMVDQVDVMHAVNIAPQVVAPGGSIKELTYLRRWHEAAERAGLRYTLAIHIYDWREWRLNDLWREFCAWFDGTGLGQCIVTECGAGARRTMDEWLAIMPWFYRLLDDRRVRALAPFGAYPQRFPNGDTYPGFMDTAGQVNALGRQWMEYRQ